MVVKQEIYGVRAIIECIEAKQSIEKVWLLKGQASPIFKELERLLRENNVAHSYVPKERLDRFNAKTTKEQSPQFLLLILFP